MSGVLCFLVGLALLAMIGIALYFFLKWASYLDFNNIAQPPEWLQYIFVGLFALLMVSGLCIGAYQIGCSILHHGVK